MRFLKLSILEATRNLLVTILNFSSKIKLLLTIIFNYCLATKYFPIAWMNPIVIPIPKPAKDSSSIANWLTTLQILSIAKIFEKILDNCIRNFFESNHHLSENSETADQRFMQLQISHNGLKLTICIRKSKISIRRRYNATQNTIIFWEQIDY